MGKVANRLLDLPARPAVALQLINKRDDVSARQIGLKQSRFVIEDDLRLTMTCFISRKIEC
jgi:hypothetical protein